MGSKESKAKQSKGSGLELVHAFVHSKYRRGGMQVTRAKKGGSHTSCPHSLNARQLWQ